MGTWMKKRFLSILMTLCMIFGMMPAAAFPAKAAAGNIVTSFIAQGNGYELLSASSNGSTSLVQEVAIGGRVVLPTQLWAAVNDNNYVTDLSGFTTIIKDASGVSVSAINTSGAGTYTVRIGLPAGYVLQDGITDPVMTVKVGPTVYEKMYAADSDVRPAPLTPGDPEVEYGFLNNSAWKENSTEAGGGIRTNNLRSAQTGTTYKSITIPVPNDAYYTISAEMGTTTPVLAEGQSQPIITVGIVLDTYGGEIFNGKSNWVTPGGDIGSNSTRTERTDLTTGGSYWETFPLKATDSHQSFGGTLSKKGGDIQFLAGIESSYMTTPDAKFYAMLRNVSLKKLTNSFSVATEGSGTGKFDLTWKDTADTGVNAAKATEKSGTIGRGDTATLTASADSGSYFEGWYQGSTCVSTDRTFTFVAGQNADDAAPYNYTARFRSGKDPVLSGLIDTSVHNTNTDLVTEVRDGWSAGTDFVSISSSDKPLTLSFTTSSADQNVYFDAALSNMDLNCFLDGASVPFTLPGETKTIDYAQADWSRGKTCSNGLPENTDAFEFHRSVVIPVAAAGKHTLTFRTTKDVKVVSLDLTPVTDSYIYAKLSGLGINSEKIKLTGTANADCPATISVNGGTEQTLTGSAVEVPYNSFIKLVSTPASGILADGFTITNTAPLYTRQACCTYGGVTYANNTAPDKSCAEFSAKAAGTVKADSITAAERSNQINSAVVKPGTEETYTWTASDGAWEAGRDSTGNACLISSYGGTSVYYTHAVLQTDFTVPENEYQRLSFDAADISYSLFEVSKADGTSVYSDSVSGSGEFTSHSTAFLPAGTYQVRIMANGENPLRLKNFTVSSMQVGKIAYSSRALAPYGDNPDISETVNGWGAWTSNTNDVVEGQPVVFTLNPAKVPDGYVLQSITVNGVNQVLNDNHQFTVSPSAGDAASGFAVSLLYISPKVGIYNDAEHKKIYANGYPVLVSGNTVKYYDAGAKAARTALNSGAASQAFAGDGYSVYGGGYQQDVASTDVHIQNFSVAGVSIYGGGLDDKVTGNSTVDLIENVSISGVSVYGGGENGAIGGNVNFTASTGSTNAVILYGAGKGGSVAGNVTLKVSATGKCGAIYGGGRDCAVTGDILTTVTSNNNPSEFTFISGGAETSTTGNASAKSITLELNGGVQVTNDVSVQGNTDKAGSVSFTTASSYVQVPEFKGGITGGTALASDVTLTIGSGTVVKGSITGSTGTVSGSLTINMNAVSCDGGIYTGKNIAASAVNINAAYLNSVNIQTGRSAPVQGNASYACGIYKKTGSDVGGYDVYTLSSASGITYDETNRILYLNGLKGVVYAADGNNKQTSMTVGGSKYQVTYRLPDNTTWNTEYYAEDQIDTIYAGAKDYPVGSTDLTVSAFLSDGRALTVYGGGQEAAATVLNDTHVTASVYPGQTVYGGGNEGPVLGDTNLTYEVTIDNRNKYIDSTVNGTAVAFAGCRNADVSGDSNLTVEEGNAVSYDTYAGQNKWLLYGSSEKGTVGGNINITVSSVDLISQSFKGICALHDDADVSGKINLHANAYTATPFYIPAGSAQVDTTNANVDAVKTAESGQVSGVYTIATKLTLKTGKIYANGIPVLYNGDDWSLYFDNGTIGVLDSEDERIPGMVGTTVYLGTTDYYLGSDTQNVEKGTFTDLGNFQHQIYMGGSDGYKITGDSTVNLFCDTDTSIRKVCTEDSTVGGDSILNLGRTTDTGTRTVGDIYADGLTKIVLNQPFKTGSIRHVTSGVTPVVNFDTTVAALKSEAEADGNAGRKYTCDFSAAATQMVTSAVLQWDSGAVSTYPSVYAQGNVLLGQDGEGNYVFWEDKNGNRAYNAGTDTELLKVASNVYTYESNYIPAFRVILTGDNSEFTTVSGFAGTVPYLICRGSYQDVLHQYGTITKVTFEQYKDSGKQYEVSNGHFTVNGQDAVISRGAVYGQNITVDLLQGSFKENGGEVMLENQSEIGSYSVKLGSGFTLTPAARFQNFTTADFSAYNKTLTPDTVNTGGTHTYYTELADGSTENYADSSKCIPPDGYAFEKYNNAYRLYKLSSASTPVLALGSICYGTSKTVEITEGTPDSTYFTTTGTNSYTLKSTLLPGNYIAAVKDGSGSVVKQVTFTVSARILNITPNAITKYTGQPNLWGKAYYTAVPADDAAAVVTLPDGEDEILTYSGQETAGTYAPELMVNGSSNGGYIYRLTGAAGKLTINAAGTAPASATVSSETLGENGWYKGNVILIAPDGYLISLSNSGTAAKTVVFTPADETARAITYYLKDQRTSSDTYGAYFNAEVTGQIKTDLNAPKASAPAVSGVTETGAVISMSEDDTGMLYVLARKAADPAPAASEIVSAGVSAAYSETDLSGSAEKYITVTGLTGATGYIAYAVAKDKSGQLSDVVNVNFTTSSRSTSVITAPTASAVYGTTLDHVELDATAALVHAAGDGNTAVPGTWAWDETEAATIYPTVGSSATYTVKFTPSDSATCKPVTAEIQVSVSKKAVSVTALNQTVLYGGNIENTVSWAETNGLARNDALSSITLSGTGTDAGTEGTITASGAAIRNGLEDVTENYEITYYNGTLTVTKSTPGIAFASYTPGKIYDGTALVNPSASELAVTGAGADFSQVVFTWYDVSNSSRVRLSGIPVNAGTYVLVASLPATGNTASASAESSPVSIAQAGLEIVAGNQTIIYGRDIEKGISKVSVSAPGLIPGDILTGITLKASGLDAVTGGGFVNASKAVIMRGTSDVTANYDITYTDGSLTVNKSDFSYALPLGLKAFFGDKLSDIVLPDVSDGTWSWDNPSAEAGNAGTRSFPATFTPNDTEHYNVMSGIMVSVAVSAADPGIGKVSYTGGAVYDSTSVSEINAGLTRSDTSVPGTLALDGVSSLTAGTKTFTWKFVPADTANYKTVTGTITLNVLITAVTDIALDKTELKFAAAGETATLIATASPANATVKAIGWSSSDTAVATVDNAGKVTARANGTATVTAAATDGSNVRAECLVTVDIPFVSVTGISGVTQNGRAGAEIPLNGKVIPEDATRRDIVWSVTDAGTTGAELNGNILKTAAAGTVRITATVQKGVSETQDYTETFTVSITDASDIYLEDINVKEGTEIFLYAGDNAVYASPADATESDAEIRYCDMSVGIDPATLSNAEEVQHFKRGEPQKIRSLSFDGVTTYTVWKVFFTEDTETCRYIYVMHNEVYDIMFDANGGTCDVTEEKTDENGYLKTIPAAERNGYRFAGWFTASSGGTAVNTGTRFASAETVYAHWTALPGKDSSGSGGSSGGSGSGNSSNGGQWIKNGTGWWFKNADGTWPGNAWALINGTWYHFNSSGYMQTGWVLDNGKWYYMDPDTGSMRSGLLRAQDGYWYYFWPDGSMAVGDVVIDGRIRHFNDQMPPEPTYEQNPADGAWKPNGSDELPYGAEKEQ